MTYSCSRPLRRGLRALRMSIIGRRSSSAIPGTASSISRAGCRLHQRLQREATRQKRLHIARNGAVVFAHMLA